VPETDNETVTILPKKADAPEPARVQAPVATLPAPSPRPDAVGRRASAPEAKGDAPPTAAPAPAAEQYAAAPRFEAALRANSDDKGAEGSAEPSTDSDASYDAAMAAYRDGRYSEAQHRFDEIASLGGPHAANASLYGAQALRRVSGCPTAAPRFEEVHTRYPGSVGSDAAWQAADCYRSLGDLARARQTYDQLSSDPSYKARAKEAIAELDQRVADQELAAKRAAAAATAPAAAAKAKPTAPAKPAASK
jgi:TolA-binding protein